MSDAGDSRIVVEVTDPKEHYCFRLTFKAREARYCETHPAGECDITGPACVLRIVPCEPIVIMLHGRSLVDLINKASIALCDWQAETTAYLIEKITGARPGPP